MNNTSCLPNLKFLESSKQHYVKEITEQTFISPGFRFEDYLAHSWLWGHFALDRAEGGSVYYSLSLSEPESPRRAAISPPHHLTGVTLLI